MALARGRCPELDNEVYIRVVDVSVGMFRTVNALLQAMSVSASGFDKAILALSPTQRGRDVVLQLRREMLSGHPPVIDDIDLQTNGGDGDGAYEVYLHSSTRWYLIRLDVGSSGLIIQDILFTPVP
jgi:hypothetical protein